MSNPDWCTYDEKCKCNFIPSHGNCKVAVTDEGCPHYNPKMTFFEAWEKAEEGDKLINQGFHKCTRQQYGYLRYDNGEVICQNILFEKVWTILPKKKTVTHEIPEGAENLFITYRKEASCPHWLKTSDIKQISYEVDNTQKP